jgi:hypothetical protein
MQFASNSVRKATEFVQEAVGMLSNEHCKVKKTAFSAQSAELKTRMPETASGLCLKRRPERQEAELNTLHGLDDDLGGEAGQVRSNSLGIFGYMEDTPDAAKGRYGTRNESSPKHLPLVTKMISEASLISETENNVTVA